MSTVECLSAKCWHSDHQKFTSIIKICIAADHGVDGRRESGTFFLNQHFPETSNPNFEFLVFVRIYTIIDKVRYAEFIIFSNN